VKTPSDNCYIIKQGKAKLFSTCLASTGIGASVTMVVFLCKTVSRVDSFRFSGYGGRFHRLWESCCLYLWTRPAQVWQWANGLCRPFG